MKTIPYQSPSCRQKICKLKYKNQIERFCRLFQKYDLIFSEPIQNAFIIDGFTKIGKTSLCHYLSGIPLTGSQINGQIMAIPLNPTNKQACVGTGLNSETCIPNHFPVQFQGKTQLYNIIDPAGYNNASGALDIINNGFCAYRIFSKTKNIKFILCFESNQLKNDCADFIDTIVQWSCYFKDYLQVRKQIWKSVTFVITKVKDIPTIKEVLIAKLKFIVQNIKTMHDKSIEEAVKELIQFIIEEDRLFYVKEINNGETMQQKDLLEKIDKNISQWWSRESDEVNKQVCMESVQLAVSENIIKSTTNFPASRLQLIDFIDYFKIRCRQLFSYQGSLQSVTNQLVKDAMGQPHSHNFINFMKIYNDLYYNIYDQSFKVNRQKRQKQLFSPDQKHQQKTYSKHEQNPDLKHEQNTAKKHYHKNYQSKDQNTHETGQSYLLKKFQSLQQIQRLKQKLWDIELSTKIEVINYMQNSRETLNKIITAFGIIFNKKNLAVEVINKYGYIINRFIQENMIWHYLVQIYAAKHKQKIRGQANGNYLDLFNQLRHFGGIPFRYNKRERTYEQLHVAFINRFSFDEVCYSSMKINSDFFDFFYTADNYQKQNFDYDKQIFCLKQRQAALKHSEIVLEESQKMSKIILDKKTRNLIKKLVTMRVDCENSFHLSEKNSEKACIIENIRDITKNLGRLLEFFKQYRLSREVYKTILFVSSVCRLYRYELKLLRKPKVKSEDKQNKSEEKRKKELDLRLEFSKYLAEHCREHEAMKVLQDCFELAKGQMELNRTSQQFNDIMMRTKDYGNVVQYSSNLFNGEWFQNLPDKLISELQTYSNSDP